MAVRSSRRAARLLFAALAASAAPVALIPSVAQEYVGVFAEPESPTDPAPAPVETHAWPTGPEVTRGTFYDGGETPLELQPHRLGAFDTANTLPEGTLSLYVGQKQTFDARTGTGNQAYFGGGRYAPTDRLTLGFDFWSYVDPVVAPIGGGYPHVKMEPMAVSAEYRLFERGALAGSVLGSLEGYNRLNSSLYGGKATGQFVGALKAPFTLDMSSRFQFHLTPAVSVFPDSVNGQPFYGTIASLGGGVSYKPSRRLSFYGAVEVPFGPGGNTIDGSGNYVNVPVWTVGGRYNVSPKVALDAFVTNSVGMTPATGILTIFPDGDTPLLGVQLTFTPGASYPESYRGRPAELTARQENLQHDGFTLGSPGVLDPLTFAPLAWYGGGENYGFGTSVGISRDFGADIYYERYSLDPSVDPALRPTNEPRYMFGPKLRFLDQNNGDPFNLSARLLFGRSSSLVGVYSLEGMASYDVNDRLTVSANPRLAGFGNVDLFALGGGVNYELFDGLEVIAEASAVFGDSDQATWAAGLRYNAPNSGISVDVSATNAIGRYGIGTLVAQDDPRFSIGVSKSFSLR
ncbi:hypothetical protein P1J78_18015 [Psychromarinibacter sp. C21-152]|uniref:Opacity protein n=1 Tax=Psychromarinibacter sediminicola TaxID=3033385 RepID=A0AAE3NSC4_9RHOB|nr:hypothetical protein [Psychromarinibacter sediminicola]MDF0602638.1 hypothetical protein [Psychromarinibacter sediminicola]